MEKAAESQDAPDYTAIPANDYDFVISKAEYKKASTGRDMISIQAKVVSGDHARRVVFNNFVMVYENPTSMRIFLSQMKVLGLDAGFFETNPSLEAVAAALVGTVFRGKVEVEQYKGEDKNVLKNFSTPSAEARQAALSIPTANNPNPTASPSGFGGGVPSPSTPAAPVAPPTVPSNTPSAPPIPPPPPAPTF